MNDHSVEQLADAFRKVLEQDGDGNSFVLVKRIPIICRDIMQIKTDMRWIKWLVMGMASGVGMLAVYFLTTHN